MFLADTLSRAPLPSTAPPTNCLRPEHEEICRLDLEDVNAAEFLRVSNNGLRNIQRLTQNDCPTGMAGDKAACGATDR